ncbi:MAG: MraY family glycosyltransferase [Planctomycetota bacterium]
MLWVLAVGFIVSAGLSCALTPIVRKLAPALGLIDLPGDRKVHVQPTPRGGGIAIFLGWFLTCAAVTTGVLVGVGGPESPLSSLKWPHTESSQRVLQFSAIAIGAMVLFLTGLADDRWSLSWKFRLGLQLSVAVGVVLCGVRATVFVSQPWVGFLATVLWILVLTNAMNFLDNMDALSAGIGLIASLVFAAILVLFVREPTYHVALPLVLLAGSLLGFLVWNRPPASIFMGDCGSNLIGFLLATLTVTGTFYERSGSRHVILAPLCVMAVPLYDFSTVIFIRLMQGRSPFHGDKSHFSHRLVELGLHPVYAVMTIHLTTVMTGLGGLLLFKVTDWTGASIVVALIFCILSVIAILETVGRRSVSGMQETLAEVRSLHLRESGCSTAIAGTPSTKTHSG